MKLFYLTVLSALALSGCTAAHEILLPHRDLRSPCACAEDATPVNTQRVQAFIVAEVRV